MQTETLTEQASMAGARVGTPGVIRNVKILGRVSKNNRTYPIATMKAALPLYEGAKVNVNHPRGSMNGPRDYQDRIGSLRNVRATDDGLHADLFYNPKHPVAEQLAWDAEHAPQNVGLSHMVDAKSKREGGVTVVEQIVKVHSVDLVADPATVSSLFESTAAEQSTTFEHVTDFASFAAALRGESRRLTEAESKAFAKRLRA